MTNESPQDPDEVIVVHSDDGNPATPDDFIVTGAEGLSNREVIALVTSFQSAISGLNAGMSTITSRMTELLGQEGHHRVMEQAMADNVEAWTQVARALSPGQFTLPEDKAAVLWQVRELLARGDYGSIATIPYDEAAPVSAPTVGVVK